MSRYLFINYSHKIQNLHCCLVSPLQDSQSYYITFIASQKEYKIIQSPTDTACRMKESYLLVSVSNLEDTIASTISLDNWILFAAGGFCYYSSLRVLVTHMPLGGV